MILSSKPYYRPEVNGLYINGLLYKLNAIYKQMTLSYSNFFQTESFFTEEKLETLTIEQKIVFSYFYLRWIWCYHCNPTLYTVTYIILHTHRCYISYIVRNDFYFVKLFYLYRWNNNTDLSKLGRNILEIKSAVCHPVPSFSMY